MNDKLENANPLRWLTKLGICKNIKDAHEYLRTHHPQTVDRLIQKKRKEKGQ